MTLPDGSKVSAKKFAAQRLVELLTHGKTQLANGTDIEVNGDGWFSIYKWAVLQIDGAAPAAVDVTSGGQALKAYVVVSPSDWPDKDADIRTAPVADSTVA